MKVAFAVAGAPTEFELGWARAFEHVGHKVTIWPIQQKPAFDFFSEVEPELLMVHTANLTRAIIKNITSRTNLKVFLWGSHWGTFDAEINREADGQMLATDVEKNAVSILTNLRPDIKHIFSPYTKDWAEVTHDRWKNFGLQPVGLPPAADHFIYSNGVYQKNLASDVAFIGQYHQSYASFLLPLCREMRCKLFSDGPSGWPVAQYLGSLHPQNRKNILASAKVLPNIYTTDYGFEIGERPFQTLVSGGFCLSLYTDALGQVFGQDTLCFCDRHEFHDRVKFYVAHPEEAIYYIEHGLKAIADGHTYMHRLDLVAGYLGLL